VPGRHYLKLSVDFDIFDACNNLEGRDITTLILEAEEVCHLLKTA
jgi:hypothetical protein